MRVLMIGSDRRLLEPGSEAATRHLAYAKKFSELHLIVFALKKLKTNNYQLSANCWVYPTNSSSRWLYWRDAYRLALGLGRFDLVSGQDPFECGLAAYLTAKKTKTKLQLQIHTDFLSPYFAYGSFLNQVRVWLAGFLLPRADMIRVVSQRIADSLQTKNYKLKTTPVILPIFVDVEKIKQAPIKTDLHRKYSQFNKIILMASRLTREKNIGLAIEAMSRIVKTRPKTGLLIVGSGPEEASLKLKARSYKLGANIIFEPWTNDLISYYKTADLFLVTSLYEGYGLTLVEAAAAGCPIVSTDVGVAREQGAKIAENNVTSVATKILELLS